LPLIAAQIICSRFAVPYGDVLRLDWIDGRAGAAGVLQRSSGCPSASRIIKALDREHDA
jgi:hypothetical protein